MTGLARTAAVLCLALGSVALIGCGSEDHIILPTPTPAQGPVITFMGLTRADDVLIPPATITPSPDGIKVYTRRAPSGGSGFRIVIEGKPGLSGADPGTSAFEQSGAELPDLQIIVSQALGDGSPAVCDFVQPKETPTAEGGVPATDPPSFEAIDTVAPRVNDLSCRFVDGAWQPVGRTDPGDSCVQSETCYYDCFVSAESTIQFCTAPVERYWSFPQGRTLVTARLRDVAGNVGPPAQIYIDVTPQS